MEYKHNDTGMYVIDKDYHILNMNSVVKKAYPDIREGNLCYKAMALSDSPCDTCPLQNDHMTQFYNRERKVWISANAATMDYPGHGECYNIQFRVRLSGDGTREKQISRESLEEHIADLQAVSGKECVIGAYYEAGSPIFYVNEQMASMMGYDSTEELIDAIDGLVVNTVHPDDRGRVRKDMAAANKVGTIYETTYRMPRKDGTWFWAVTKGKTIITPAGRIATISVCSDMSELLKRHEELKVENKDLTSQKELSQMMIDNIPSGYHRCKAEEGCPFIFIGKHFTDIVGWSREEIECKFDNLYHNLVWEEDVGVMATYVDMLSMRGKGNSYDTSVYRVKHKDGGYRWVTDSTMFVDLGENSFFQSTIADITEYVESLNAAREKAEASNLAKSTFLFNASHDIRTPMNAIQGFAHIIEENADDPQMVRDTIRKVKQSSNTLMTLMNDVLELSRIERGKDEINEQPINMVNHAEKLYEMFCSEMEQAGISFVMKNDIIHPVVMGDELKLTRIAMNLLSNAKKFTPAGGSVTFGVCEEGYSGKTAIYRLYVRDTGIGMSKEFQEHAFEQFERERTSTDSGVGGSGLGLAIAKKLADLMDGSCNIESEPGKGSEITVEIPLHIVEASNCCEKDADRENADFTGKRVLLVEDNEFNREIAGYLLRSIGFDVDEVENGADCIEKLLASQQRGYDLILMDIQMPIMDGYKTASEIRRMEDRHIAATPIVAMTANAFDEDEQKCIDMGMNGHIGKPIDPQVLLRTIAELL